MAPKKAQQDQVQEPVAAPPADESAADAQASAPARPAQGITIRYLDTGNPTVDFHRKWRKKRKIDPASLIVDGKDPVLALPVDGEPARAFKRVGAEHAADLLLCDFVSGGQSIFRLATDEEVKAYEAELEYRAQHKGIPAKK